MFPADLTITGTIALVALVSPIITTLLNNCHQRKMKRMELEHDAALRREEHQREVFEQYSLAAGRCLYSHEAQDHENFGARSALALYYTTDKGLRGMMEQFERALHENYDPSKELIILFEKITELIYALQQKS